VIRVPFNQEWALERSDYDPTLYRSALESVIEMAATHEAYTLLDLQWLDNHTVRGTTGEQPNYVSPLPNTDSIILWQQLSKLWCDETAILYDVFNEPHDKLADDTQPLLGIRGDSSTFALQGRSVGPDEWLPWARQLIAAIRLGNPNALIFLPGTNWAFNLQGCVMPDMGGIVYSTHIYVRNGGSDPTKWDQIFGSFAESVPVFVGEFGGYDNEVDWGTQLADYFDEHGIGWTAWSWSDDPHLVESPPSFPFEPTPFGLMVQKRLTASTMAVSGTNVQFVAADSGS
jgi:aryl-phospho-beta-D-glucosidase BglC (GH1 family)